MNEPRPPALIDVVDCELRLSRPVAAGEASLLRGYLGRTFEEEVLLHHHHPDGGLVYNYPRVQFKVLDRTAHLIAVGEGCPLATRLWAEVGLTRIGVEDLAVLESRLSRRREPLGEAAGPIAYCFRTPWLGLNQGNHRRYLGLTGPAERRALLARILVGNCLAVAKSFGHRVVGRLTADAGGLRPWTTRFKGVVMQGFVGTFRVNFHLPDRVGIGKSVSRGFGTLERQQL
jgi:hypothetical protein